MRGSQVARQWKIIKLIEGRESGLTIEDLANRLDTPVRTIYRDLEALQESGFPLYSEVLDRRAFWKFVDGYRRSFPIPMNVTELVALHVSRDLLRVFDGTIFHDSIESLFHKMEAALPPTALDYLNKISSHMKAGLQPVKSYKAVKEFISQVSQAAADNYRIEITYGAMSTGQETIRTVDPYQVWVMNGNLYLIGKCHLRNEVRTFSMDRIKGVRLLEERFDPPEDFSLEDYLHSAFRVMKGTPQKIKIRFSPGAAPVIRERTWHPTQEIKNEPDGSVVVSLESSINYEVTSWILGFGSAAEVLEPMELKTQIRRELEAALRKYGH
jgi:predicted DNA-binding transcriptional regulator YafY